MATKVSVYFADGFEEIEALTSVDVLRRAGCEVTMLSIGSADSLVASSHGVLVKCDARGEDFNSLPDVVVFPGGMPGAKNLSECQICLDCARKVVASGGIAAAICAAPIVLNAAGLLAGRSYTCYPGIEKQIGGGYAGGRVLTDGQIVTGCGPGASLEFALAIVAKLFGNDAAKKLGAQMQQA